jgi:hypothetical protein
VFYGLRQEGWIAKEGNPTRFPSLAKEDERDLSGFFCREKEKGNGNIDICFHFSWEARELEKMPIRG